jgi:hypothetical protein
LEAGFLFLFTFVINQIRKTMLKKVLIGLGVIVAITLIAAAFLPKAMNYSQSIAIDASPEQVWQFTSSLEGMDKWSPWNAKDPGMKQNMTGTRGEIGSEQCWESTKKEVGVGCQKIIAKEEFKHLETEITFKEPFESKASAYVDLVAEGNGTTATWSFHRTNPWPFNLMGAFMDFEKMMEPDFTAGLKSLKQISEDAAEEAKAAVEALDNPAPLEPVVAD